MVKTNAWVEVRGFSQTQDVDFFDTFATATPLTSSIRTLVATACERGVLLYRLDSEQADFCPYKLHLEIYSKLPPGWRGNFI